MRINESMNPLISSTDSVTPPVRFICTIEILCIFLSNLSPLHLPKILHSTAELVHLKASVFDTTAEIVSTKCSNAP